MSMIKIENLTFSYPTSYDNVFENVSFQVDTDWKLGFVGRNGRGKTTFLNLLLGKYEYSGKILSSVQFDYFPYPVSDKNRITEDILQEICPLAEEWELMRELSYLDVDVDVLWRLLKLCHRKEETFHHGCQILSDSKNLNWLRTNVCKRTSDDYSSRQNALQYGLNV